MVVECIPDYDMCLYRSHTMVVECIPDYDMCLYRSHTMVVECIPDFDMCLYSVVSIWNFDDVNVLLITYVDIYFKIRSQYIFPCYLSRVHPRKLYIVILSN